MTTPKSMRLPPRKMLFGFDYNRNQELRMTGKEWHIYAKVDEFKTERASDSAWAKGCEIWLDGTDMNMEKGR
jgi:hypothetical protein